MFFTFDINEKAKWLFDAYYIGRALLIPALIYSFFNLMKILKSYHAKKQKAIFLKMVPFFITELFIFGTQTLMGFATVIGILDPKLFA